MVITKEDIEKAFNIKVIDFKAEVGNTEDGQVIKFSFIPQAAVEFINIDFAIGETQFCYCGSPVDTSNPDCVEFGLCEDHQMDC